MYKLKPEVDTGYTKADKMDGTGTYFCVYFARGCCTEGVNCRYYHRVPQASDLSQTDNLRDIFGRTRHATHKDNYEGVGSFNRQCQVLCVSKISLDPEQNGTRDGMTVKDIVRLVYEHFSLYGEIEDVHFNLGRFCAYIKFEHRSYAEFGREAMLDQVLVEGVTEPLRIQWAVNDNPFDKSEAQIAKSDVKQAINQMTLSEKRLGDVRWANKQTEVQQKPQLEKKEHPKKPFKKRD